MVQQGASCLTAARRRAKAGLAEARAARDARARSQQTRRPRRHRDRPWAHAELYALHAWPVSEYGTPAVRSDAPITPNGSSAPPVLLQACRRRSGLASLVTADIRRWRGRVCSVSHRQQHAGALVLARARFWGPCSRGDQYRSAVMCAWSHQLRCEVGRVGPCMARRSLSTSLGIGSSSSAHAPRCSVALRASSTSTCRGTSSVCLPCGSAAALPTDPPTSHACTSLEADSSTWCA